MKIITLNKKIRMNYEVVSTIEAGIQLLGPEIKSLRNNEVVIDNSYVSFDGKGAYISDMHISEYKNKNNSDKIDPLRQRRLLLHKNEILKLNNEIKQKKLFLIPTKLYFNKNSFVKLELALCRSLRKHDKREKEKERDAKKESKSYMDSY